MTDEQEKPPLPFWFLAAMLVAGTALHGVAIFFMWGWFIAPLAGVEITAIQATGAWMMWRAFFLSRTSAAKNATRTDVFTLAITVPTLVLAGGWTLHTIGGVL
jgi:uncharacterized iron-regulated membrane protein